MPDYTKATGTRGTMMIRDTGSTVEFWIKSSSSSVYMYGKDWSYQTPNGNGSGSFDYSGDDWKKLGSKVVSDSGVVRFRIEYTGASYFAGPTELAVTISRAELPGNPSGLSETRVAYTVATLAWANSGASNGGDFKRFQYQVSSTPQSGSGNFKGTVEITDTTTAKTVAINGLSPGTVYDWHVRQENEVGWGPWSGIASFQTLWGAYVRSADVWKKAVPYVRSSDKWQVAVPYIKSSGAWTVPDA